ncbi:hypothetical protein PFICI_10225 [Pestalotiopsis fici W106-1]|uniref:Uncharacterized protein n=1 Tax=Pestalotiopsis fici (strain W106-1 / CGMCC3.15140) TaxID=1229662 RepID=W3WWA7_PESFW|nr:uncharacterized protein PFICI_10225 [Pestalotiopsis fici W106-1]ETS78163.1 hypothetical protein PFICI_10225 [Pestalotiopsis fici W106-1]
MSTELPGERALGDFHWNGVPLRNVPASWDDCKSLLDHTVWIVDNLRRCPFNAPRVILENSTKIERLFRPQMKRNEPQDKWEKAHVDLNDENKATALAYYLFFDSDQLILDRGVNCCGQCRNENNFGPGDTCFSGLKHVLQGACFNCVYNSTSDLCTFKRAADTGRFLGFTQNLLKQTSTEALLDMYDMTLEELEARRRRGEEES